MWETSSLLYLRSAVSERKNEGISVDHAKLAEAVYQGRLELTCIDGFCKCPKFDVVCRGSGPKTIALGLISLNASITT